MVMYFRFVGAEKHPHCRNEVGVYHFVGNLDDNFMPVWLEGEFKDALEILCRLDVPTCLEWRSRHPATFRSRCWFKPEATEMIRTARYLAWICTESGYPVRELRSRAPGMIIWEDDRQIVAVPRRVRR